MHSIVEGPRTERTLYNEQSAWIKRPEKQRSDFVSFLHKSVSIFLPTVLKPTLATGGLAGLLEEADRLKNFSAKSVVVPEVLNVSDDSIILSDCGPHLRHVLKTTSDKKEVADLLKRATGNLAEVHAKGLVHGRPHLKDMTLKDDGSVCLLDLEEDPLKVMGLDAARARDIWLLLSSCAEFCDHPLEDLTDLLSLYRNSTTSNIDQELRNIARSGRPFRKIIGFFRASNVGRDVFGAYWATLALETL
ncbi:MAG: hypothetical protein ABJO09_19110 [Hyphomicrobiales bacterium]